VLGESPALALRRVLTAALRREVRATQARSPAFTRQERIMSLWQALVPHDRERAVELLQSFFGEKAEALFESHGGSLAALLDVARESSNPELRLLGRAAAIAEAAAAEQAAERDALTTPEAVKRLLQLHFAGQSVESFVVLYLDAANRLIAAEDLFRGTLSQTSVYPREVVRRALHFNAASIICSHCHPSGVCEPSKADEFLTQTLRQALLLVDVRLLDHILVAGGTALSFAQRGLV
jgi:DNA repair protein RadC